MTSSTGKQIFTIHILPNISISKRNQPMEFGQVIEYNSEIFFFKSHVENKTGRLVQMKASGQRISFNIYW